MEFYKKSLYPIIKQKNSLIEVLLLLLLLLLFLFFLLLFFPLLLLQLLSHPEQWLDQEAQSAGGRLWKQSADLLSSSSSSWLYWTYFFSSSSSSSSTSSRFCPATVQKNLSRNASPTRVLCWSGSQVASLTYPANMSLSGTKSQTQSPLFKQNFGLSSSPKRAGGGGQLEAQLEFIKGRGEGTLLAGYVVTVVTLSFQSSWYIVYISSPC